MKLQKLIIENIASIEKACIDLSMGRWRGFHLPDLRTDGSRQVDAAGCGMSGTL